MASDLSVALSRLHAVLLELEEVEARLAEGPRRIALGERKIQQAVQAIDQQKEAIKGQRRKVDEANLRMKTKEGDLLKLQGVLNQAKSNKEFDIVKGQIAAAEVVRSSVEDEALQGMELLDQMAADLKALEAGLATAKGDQKDLEARVAATRDGLAADIARLQSEATEAERVIPSGDPRIMWIRLRGAYGPAALSKLEDSFCGHCNSKVTTQDMCLINTNTFMLCKECGRVLYHLGASGNSGKASADPQD